MCRFQTLRMQTTAAERRLFYFGDGTSMHFCFLDESGDSSMLAAPSDAKQAALIVAGLFVDARRLPAVTADLMALKRQYFPGQMTGASNVFDALLIEIKGSDHITKVLRKQGHKATASVRALRFLDEILDLCIRHQIRLVGRSWVKEVGQPMVDKSVYTVSAQNIVERFQEYLQQVNSEGVIIADFRDPKRNSYVAHSIFTQMHKKSGSAYPRVQETIVFGISDNHAGLQIADLLTSAALLPLLSKNYLMGRFRNAHTHPSMHIIAQRVERKIKRLEFNFQHYMGQCRGLTVADPRNKKAKFFPLATAAQPAAAPGGVQPIVVPAVSQPSVAPVPAVGDPIVAQAAQPPASPAGSA